MATSIDIPGTAVVFGNGTVAGTTDGGVTTSGDTTTSSIGKGYNYTVVVQIPVPFFNLGLNVNLLADFILPALTVVGVPQAITFMLANAERILQLVLNDLMYLVKAIPEASVTVLVRLGSIPIINIQLVAEKVPVVVTPPTFVLALPNFAADLSFGVSFPAPPPIVVLVPVPYPVINPVPLVALSGGQVSLAAGAGVAVGAPGSGASLQGESSAPAAAVIPPVISSPISLPEI